MIELAPHHKTGLPIKYPLMPAAGFFGYGPNPYPDIIDSDLFGAIVTNPITLRPQFYRQSPPVCETSGGILLDPRPANPGVKRVIQRHKRDWLRSPIPCIAHLPAEESDDLARTARALASQDILAGFEIGLAENTSPYDVRLYLDSIRYDSELPLLVKLPRSDFLPLAESAMQTGTDALVFAMPPLGLSYLHDQRPFSGHFYGPGLVAQILADFIRLREIFPDVPLIASGGVHTVADAQAYLQAGAAAIQIDSLLFVDPAQVQQLLLFAKKIAV